MTQVKPFYALVDQDGDIQEMFPENHDFLAFEVEGPDHLVKWYLTEVSIRDRMVCVYQLEEE